METVLKHFSELTATELYDILKLRAAVFVVEQNCPYQDLDDYDRDCYHLWLKDEKGIAAYLRILDKGRFPDSVSLGRVISARRRQGIGTKLMLEGIKAAKEVYGADRLMIGAQCYAVPFYEGVGFRVVSGEYLEDGIPHVYMELK